ncbi:MAG: hypothetical protein O3C40_24650 [Planctomycetota bacterium]|nr:hypothetical protein [Planctomycetota bacterium]
MLKRSILAIVGIATLVAVSYVSAQRTTTMSTLAAPDLLDLRGGQWGSCYRPLTDGDLTNDCTGTRQYTLECKDHGCTWVAPLMYICKESAGTRRWNGDDDYHNVCLSADEGVAGKMTCGFTFTFCETFYQCNMCDIDTGAPICAEGSVDNDGNTIQKVTVHGTACVGAAPDPSLPMPGGPDPFDPFGPGL